MKTADEQLAEDLIARRSLPTAGANLSKLGALALAAVIGGVVWFRYFRK